MQEKMQRYKKLALSKIILNKFKPWQNKKGQTFVDQFFFKLTPIKSFLFICFLNFMKQCAEFFFSTKASFCQQQTFDISCFVRALTKKIVVLTIWASIRKFWNFWKYCNKLVKKIAKLFTVLCCKVHQEGPTLWIIH